MNRDFHPIMGDVHAVQLIFTGTCFAAGRTGSEVSEYPSRHCPHGSHAWIMQISGGTV